MTGEDVRRGFETLSITDSALEGDRASRASRRRSSVTCDDHNGHHSAYMQQWDGTKWVKVSDWIAPMKDKVRPMLEAAAKDYVSKDPAWPKRTRALRQVELMLDRLPACREGGERSEPGGVW